MEQRTKWMVAAVCWSVLALLFIILGIAKIFKPSGVLVALVLEIIIFGLPVIFIITRKVPEVRSDSPSDTQLINEINTIAAEKQRPQIDTDNRSLWKSEWKTYKPAGMEPMVYWSILAPVRGTNQVYYGLWRYDITHRRIDYDNTPNIAELKAMGLYYNHKPFEEINPAGSTRTETSQGRAMNQFYMGGFSPEGTGGLTAKENPKKGRKYDKSKW